MRDLGRPGPFFHQHFSCIPASPGPRALVVAAAAASQDNTAHTVRNSTANSTVVQNASIASNHTTAANQSTLSKPGPVGNETVGADHHPANQTIAKEPVTNQTVANQTVANQTVANQTVANQTAGNQTVANQTVSGNSSIHPVTFLQVYVAGLHP